MFQNNITVPHALWLIRVYNPTLPCTGKHFKPETVRGVLV